MKYAEPISRYYMLLSLLQDETRDTRIKALADSFSISAKQIREDMAALFASAYTRNFLSIRIAFLEKLLTAANTPTMRTPVEVLQDIQEPGEEPDMDDFVRLVDCFEIPTENAVKVFKDLVSQGKLDDIPFYLISFESAEFRNHELPIAVTAAEASAINKYLPFFVRKFPKADYTTKSTITAVPQKIRTYITRIMKAQRDGYDLKINWMTKTGEQLEEVIHPVGIFQNAEDHNIFCISQSGKAIPLQAVSCLRPTTDYAPPCEHPLTEDDVTCMWGIPTWDETRPVPVEIKIWLDDHTRNLLTRMRAETVGRPYASLRENADGTYTYTDRVLGIDGFRRWLRSYGSTLEVISPDWLAQKMYRSAQQLLQCYKEGRFLD